MESHSHVLKLGANTDNLFCKLKQKPFSIVDNIRTLSENLEFICLSFRNR